MLSGSVVGRVFIALIVGPVGYQVIKRRGGFKRRLRPALFPRIPKGGWARVSSIMRKDVSL